jgi:DHA1 family bicyclomycin/chloramphenicol resistance-like MFS transporter
MSDLPLPRLFDRTTPPHILTLVLISGVAALSLNVFLPSLPQMAQVFGVDYGLMQLSVSLYLAMTAVLQLLIGPVSDRFGRRPVLLAAAAIFTAATLLAMAAPNFGVFLACRLVQAVIATGFALSRAIVRDMVPQDRAASMIGYVTMGMSLVPMVGPVIGGALDQAFGWQASFALLAACGAGLFALIWADLGETATLRATSFAAQARTYPALLRSQRFWGYCLAAGFASGAFFAYLGGAPKIGADVYHLSPARLGVYFGAPAVGYLVGNFLSGRFAMRFGVIRMVILGSAVATAGLAVLAVLAALGLATAEVFFGFMVFVGLGNGIMLPSANAGMLSVRPELAGSAAGLGGAVVIGFGAAVAAVAGAVLSSAAGPLPMVALMLATSAASVPCVLWVRARARAVGAA